MSCISPSSSLRLLSCQFTSEVFIPHGGGGESMARAFSVPFLGRLPLDSRMLTCCEEGEALILRHPDSPCATQWLRIVENFAARVGDSLGASLREAMEEARASQQAARETSKATMTDDEEDGGGDVGATSQEAGNVGSADESSRSESKTSDKGPKGAVPENANEHCPGTAAETAGKSSACAGCPNKTACASGAGKKSDGSASWFSPCQSLCTTFLSSGWWTVVTLSFLPLWLGLLFSWQLLMR